MDRGFVRLLTLTGALAVVFTANAIGASLQDPKEEQRATDPTDQAALRSIVIQPLDMPGWRPFARYPPGGGSGCPKFDPDRSAFTITGETLGRQFTRRSSKIDEAFTSAAWSYATEDDALGEWKIYTSAASVACTREQLTEATPKGSLNVTARAVPLGLPRVAPRQFTRRYRLLWFTGGEMGSIYFDDTYLGRGRAEVSLLVQRVGPDDKPPTAALERRLVRLLGERLNTAFP